MENKILEKIKRNPFGIEVKKIISLNSDNAISGESFCIVSKREKKYKLRCCRNLKRAKEIENNIRNFTWAVPKFYGRRGRFLLFAWVEGKILSESMPSKIYFELGKMIGRIHASEKKVKFDVDSLFYLKFERLKDSKVFSKLELNKIRKLYSNLKSKINVKSVIELADFHEGNFIVNKNGKVFFVDEEGINKSIKGFGFSKPLLEFGWMKDLKRRKAFWKGYNKYYDNSFFAGDYEKFIGLIYAVRIIGGRYQRGADYLEEKKYLLKLLDECN